MTHSEKEKINEGNSMHLPDGFLGTGKPVTWMQRRLAELEKVQNGVMRALKRWNGDRKRRHKGPEE